MNLMIRKRNGVDVPFDKTKIANALRKANISVSLDERLDLSSIINIADTIENQRMSISGVDEDEEALDLIKFQNAYNLSSKMISVMAEIYDRLILQTGV